MKSSGKKYSTRKGGETKIPSVPRNDDGGSTPASRLLGEKQLKPHRPKYLGGKGGKIKSQKMRNKEWRKCKLKKKPASRVGETRVEGENEIQRQGVKSKIRAKILKSEESKVPIAKRGKGMVFTKEGDGVLVTTAPGNAAQSL